MSGALHPTNGISSPYGGPSGLVPPWIAFTWQGPAKTNKYALQGSTSHMNQSKPHLIREPLEHVHQNPPFQIKQMLKDLINFAKFRYGRGVKVPYWVGQSPSQGCFPRRTYLSHVVSVRWIQGKTSRHGVLDIQGFVLSHLWVPL